MHFSWPPVHRVRVGALFMLAASPQPFLLLQKKQVQEAMIWHHSQGCTGHKAGELPLVFPGITLSMVHSSLKCGELRNPVAAGFKKSFLRSVWPVSLWEVLPYHTEEGSLDAMGVIFF